MANKDIEYIVFRLKRELINFALIHQTALNAWGLDDNLHMDKFDVLILRRQDFRYALITPITELGKFIEHDLYGRNIRFWSPDSLGLGDNFDIVKCEDYNCWALAPELVLDKLVYSPDFNTLKQQRAKLAATLNVKNLTKQEIESFAKYVR